MTLYFFILCLSVLGGYGIYELYHHLKKKSIMSELTGPGEDSKNMNDILRLIHNNAMMGKDKAIPHNKVSKVLLMEDLDLRPMRLKAYIAKLSSKNLVKESTDSVNITPFGVQFFKVFSNDKLNLSSRR